MPTPDFTYQSRASRVVFGRGSLRHLAREAQALGAERILLLCTPRQRPLAEDIGARLGTCFAGIFDEVEMHVPIELARKARERSRALGADGAVAIGGGSTIGLAKAIALEANLPILAVPTTYAGSEMTPVYGLTEAGVKRTGTDPRVLPKTVIYDPELSVDLPWALTVTSALNAMAHAAEGLYAQDANPVHSLMAEEGIRALAAALPVLRARPADIDARSDALFGAWLCGAVLGAVGMALHHKLCHTLGGSFRLPHAAVHAVVLPHALAYNAGAAPEAMQRIARALGVPSAPEGLDRLIRDMGMASTLRDLGLREDELDRAAELACANPYWNPRPVARAGVRALLDDAFFGRAPGTTQPAG